MSAAAAPCDAFPCSRYTPPKRRRARPPGSPSIATPEALSVKDQSAVIPGIQLPEGFGKWELSGLAYLFRNSQHLETLTLNVKWCEEEHIKKFQQSLDTAKSLPFPDGIVINGDASSTSFTGDPGKTYMFRISNVGLSTSFNFRIQGHNMKLVEVEGSHTIQNIYTSLDVHVGQSLAVLVTLDQTPKDYYIVASTRFTRNILTTTAVRHYSNSRAQVSGPLPTGPSYQVQWSLQQARTIRWNLTANAARPNPQGSFHYGTIQPSRTIILANSAPLLNRKQRYAVNRVSYVVPDTPLKLADNFNISGVFSFNTNQNAPTNGPAFLATPVMPASLHQFFEIVFQNNENTIQSWHLDGYDFWVVGTWKIKEIRLGDYVDLMNLS